MNLDIIDGLYPDWHHAAACHPDHRHDPALWFPTVPATGVRNRPSRVDVTAPAKRICGGCDVRQECLADAIQRRETAGIWGGKDFERTPSSTACGTQGGYLRHLRRGTETCVDCCVAHDEHLRKKGVA